jgi:glycosyltransferase involved in cell wall biosynthesis
MKPAATIIMPLLNQNDDWLRQSVESACTQSIRCEVIVVCSAKTSGSNLALLEELRKWYQGIVLLKEKPGKYLAGAINVGICAASSSRIGLLLTDDWLESTAVEQCLTRDTDIVCTGLTGYDDHGKSIIEGVCSDRKIDDFLRRTTFEQRADYLGHFFLFQRQKLEQVGGLDESLGDTAGAGIDDYDLIWVLLEHGATVSIVEKRLYNYRDHSGERLTTRKRAESVAALNRILAKHNVSALVMRQLLAEHEYWYGKPIHVRLAELSRQSNRSV